MATIVNHRDVLLQAAAERLVQITLGDNIVIPAVRAIQLTAPSLTFQVNTSGVATPSSIGLTATLKQITGTPAFSVVSGSAGLSGSGSTRTLAYADMLSDSVTIRASLTYEGELYTSDVTIAKVRDGANAQSILESFVFIRSASAPATPTGGSFASPVPTSSPTWSDGIPAGTLPVYMSTRKFTSDGLSPQAATWAAPALTSSIGQGTKVQFSIDGVTGWHDTPAVTDQYMRTGTSTDGGVSWTYAGAVKIKGETGSAGVAGQRGPTNVTSTVAGLSTWSDASAESALTALGYVKVLMDRVTLRNSSSNPTYIETRYWDGFAWSPVGVEINGNLLVSGTITGDKLAVNALSSYTINSSGAIKSTGNGSADGSAFASITGYNTSASGYGVFGYSANAIGGFFQGAVTGVHGFAGSTGTAVKAINASSTGIALQMQGKLTWGSVTWTEPSGVGALFLRNDGAWASIPAGLTLASTTPANLGTAAVGSGTTAARSDHVHQMPTAAQVGAATASDISTAITSNNTSYVSANFALISHTHAAYALTSHNHSGVYEPANGTIVKVVGDPGGGTSIIGYIGLQRTDGAGGIARVAVYG